MNYIHAINKQRTKAYRNGKQTVKHMNKRQQSIIANGIQVGCGEIEREKAEQSVL